MSQQFVSGTLASGGSFRATPEGVEIFAPAGQSLARFGREVISGVSREGQVVTLERHNDTIVTITAASVADAHELEQFLIAQIDEASVFTTPEPEPEPAPPDYEPEPPAPPYEPEEAPPQPEPELTAPAPPTPTPSLAEQQMPGGPAYVAEPARTGGGKRWLLWGCLGCGGLLALCLVTSGILWATGFIDADDFDDDDDPTATIAAVLDPTATLPGDAAPTAPADSGTTAPPPTDGDLLQPGQPAQVEGVDITFHESRIDDEPVFAPTEGNEILILRFTITNSSGEEYIVATILQFTLEGESGETYPQSFFAETVGQLDGALAAGDTIEGEIAYEVPQGGGPYVVRFQGFLADEEAAWFVEPGN